MVHSLDNKINKEELKELKLGKILKEDKTFFPATKHVYYLRPIMHNESLKDKKSKNFIAINNVEKSPHAHFYQCRLTSNS